jgi:hypothetical protein
LTSAPPTAPPVSPHVEWPLAERASERIAAAL